MKVKWLPNYKKHCQKHQQESPEICPDFIEEVLNNGRPSRFYADKTYTHRNVFEAYYPPDTGRPYRVIVEASNEGEIIPVACWRIRDKEYRKKR